MTILKKARKATGLDQIELSDAINTNHATVSRAERGVAQPKRAVVRALFDFYERIIPLQWVYDPGHPDAPADLSKTQEKKLSTIGNKYRERQTDAILQLD